MILRAYAKLNLLLRVLRRRPDGYHDLLSVMQAVSLWDRITIEPWVDEEGIRLAVDDPLLPADETNLAYRAAELFYGRMGWEPHVLIVLEKRIPLRAGLGGGSSDAAAVLGGLNRMHGSPCDEVELRALAAVLGSDVPFFLHGGCAVAEGRGERLKHVPSIPLHAVLVCPAFGIETAWAYRHVEPRSDVSAALLAALGGPAPGLAGLLPHLANDLEPAVARIHPEVARIKAALIECGAVAALMTGSGSTVFGLFPTAEAAERAASGDRLGEDVGRLHVVEAVGAGWEIERSVDGI